MHNTVVMFSTSDHFTLRQVHPQPDPVAIIYFTFALILSDEYESCSTADSGRVNYAVIFCLCVCVSRTCVWCVVVLARALKADCWPVLSVDSVTIHTASMSRSVFTLVDSHCMIMCIHY